MTARKRKVLFWVFKLVGILVSCGLPIWAICEKFPVWTENHGTGCSVGVGLILIALVMIVVFRRTVFQFITDHLDLKHAPPLLIWLVMLVISYALVFLGEFMRDLTTVLWLGLVGCAIGTFLTYVSGRFNREEE